jgi:hypothetical protein
LDDNNRITRIISEELAICNLPESEDKDSEGRSDNITELERKCNDLYMAKRRYRRLVRLASYTQVVPLLSRYILRSMRKTIKAELAMADRKSLRALHFVVNTRRSHKSNSSDKR